MIINIEIYVTEMCGFYSHILNANVKSKELMPIKNNFIGILLTNNNINKILENKFIDLNEMYIEINQNEPLSDHISLYIKFTNKTEEILFLLQE
jgi:hypothetical protein